MSVSEVEASVISELAVWRVVESELRINLDAAHCQSRVEQEKWMQDSQSAERLIMAQELSSLEFDAYCEKCREPWALANDRESEIRGRISDVEKEILKLQGILTGVRKASSKMSKEKSIAGGIGAKEKHKQTDALKEWALAQASKMTGLPEPV